MACLNDGWNKRKPLKSKNLNGAHIALKWLSFLNGFIFLKSALPATVE